jgi:hypothetical protein
MSFRLIIDASGRPQVVLEGEPSYCKALVAAPSERETELNSGRWLVVTFAAWSMPDVRQVEMALAVIKRLDGALRFGMRPFNDVEDTQSWLSEVSSAGPTPIWVCLAEGSVTGTHHGPMESAELVDLIDRATSGRRSR